MLSTHHAIDLERGNHNARGYQEVVLKAMALLGYCSTQQQSCGMNS